MENFSRIRVEFELVAQKMVSQYMINNEKIEAEVSAGIKKAFESIDLELLVSESVKRCIEQAIKSSADWGKIRDAVQKKTDELIEGYIEKSINQFRRDFDV